MTPDASGASSPVTSADPISPSVRHRAEKRPAKTKAVLVRLTPSDYALVERIATQKAMTVPDVLRAGIDLLGDLR